MAPCIIHWPSSGDPDNMLEWLRIVEGRSDG